MGVAQGNFPNQQQLANQNFNGLQNNQGFNGAVPGQPGIIENSQMQPVFPQLNPNEHRFEIAVGRYLMFLNQSEFPYSEDNIPNIYKGRGGLSNIEGFKINLTYLLTTKFAVGVEVTSQFKKIITEKEDGTFLRETWYQGRSMVGIEYYFEPILFLNTYGIKFYYGTVDTIYSGEVFNEDGSSAAQFESVKISGRTFGYKTGYFLDYGEDDFGFRIGLDYVFGEPLKDDSVYNHSKGRFEEQSYELNNFIGYFQVRYLF